MELKMVIRYISMKDEQWEPSIETDSLKYFVEKRKQNNFCFDYYFVFICSNIYIKFQARRFDAIRFGALLMKGNHQKVPITVIIPVQ